MIGSLRGTVAATDATHVVVDVAGVGYEVAVTSKAAASMPLGEPVTISTHLHVREDALLLYGFESRTERDLFRVLLGVSGVGPKVGQAILSVLSPDALRVAVATDDVDALTQVPGVGKRGAQKILLDLKPKLADLEADVLETSGETGTVRQALESLGYSPSEIRSVLPSVDRSSPPAEQIRQALRRLGRGDG